MEAPTKTISGRNHRATSGARGTLSGTVVGIRDVELSCLVHPCVRGSTFGGLSSRACFHIATFKCALATLSVKASFVGGRL